MNRFATSAAAFALLTSVAFAQTDPAIPDAAPPAATQAAPTTELPAPVVPGADAQAGDSSGPMHEMGGYEFDDDDEDEDEGETRRSRTAGQGERGGRHMMRDHPGWRMHHGGMGRGGQGAVFRFSRGERGPSIVIRCAADDTTQECVDAIMPMLETLLQRSTAAPAQ